MCIFRVSIFPDSKCKEADAIEDLSQYICSHWKCMIVCLCPYIVDTHLAKHIWLM